MWTSEQLAGSLGLSERAAGVAKVADVVSRFENDDAAAPFQAKIVTTFILLFIP
ncbi:hypothetical protein GCM10010911_58000 [Paenibacillus nasutitermitis]|uniref:Uncharacterized protein n=1 Tax=Paenibacillus nasutitermitis TaxID=1652958 RepID=A0A916ZF92_9BACL|nr:hypothetical protein GCM10010911_58000 [Paenibacillus nasutitermitis]